MNNLIMEIRLCASPFFGFKSFIFTLIFAGLMASCDINKSVEGCMQEECQNYDSLATVDDGSCVCDSNAVVYTMNLMLTNYADNVVVPLYETLQSKLDTMQNLVNSNASIQDLQESCISVTKAWNHCAVFVFGPGENIGLAATMNTFPTDTSLIEANIASGDYNLAIASNFIAKGLPGLDYLFFAKSNLTQQEYKYAKDITDDMVTSVATVLNNWTASYSEEFISREGNDVASSLGIMVNTFNQQVDLIKGAKVGIPLGKKSLGETLETQVEGYFSAKTNDYLIATIEGLKYAFTGSIDTSDKVGMDDYLNSLGAMHSGSKTLSEAINNQFETSVQTVEALSMTLADAIIDENDKANTIYASLVDLIIMTKSDMPSAMSIAITYQDNDGD